MRIVTWNCARGPWPTKRAALEQLQADVAIVTEAPQVVERAGLSWFGDPRTRLGTTVLTRPEYRIEPLPKRGEAPCVNPFRVRGPHEFTVLAVWTWHAAQFKNYKEPLLAGLEACRGLPGPFVVAGDFNGNERFDRPRSRVKWADCFRTVEALGVVSAYHSYFREPYGAETRHTQYQTRKQSMPFHLDYVFVPQEWESCMRRVVVPRVDEFTLSDHRPVIVDLDFTRRVV